MTALEVRPLTPDAFEPFGKLIGPSGPFSLANDGSARRYDAGDVLENLRPESRLILSVFDCEPRPQPVRISSLERHAFSAQCIVPIRALRYIVVVASSHPDGTPDEASITAFLADGSCGINYAPGVWHHGIIALDQRSLFFVQSWQDMTGDDCHEIVIAARTLSRV
jgi:ureidoglycolate lyase